MIYTKSHFENLSFNPLSKDLFEDYPVLRDVLMDHSIIPDSRIFKYIIICYDPQSILVRQEKDLNVRKVNAAELAGFDTKKESDILERIYSFEDDTALDILVVYLRRFIKSDSWAAIVAYKESYWENIRLVLKPISQGAETKDKDTLEAVNKKDAIKQQLRNDLKCIPEMEDVFYGDDKKVYETVKKRTTVMSVAQANRRGRDV